MDIDGLLDFLTNLDDLNDDAQLAAFFGAVNDVYHEEISRLNNEDFEVDPEQMGNFIAFSSFIARHTKECNGRIELDLHEPRRKIAGITAYLPVLDLSGDDLLEFCRLLVWASACSVDALVDGTVRVSARFVGVYRKKESAHN